MDCHVATLLAMTARVLAMTARVLAMTVRVLAMTARVLAMTVRVLAMAESCLCEAVRPWQSMCVAPRGLRGGLPRRYAPRNDRVSICNDGRSARNDRVK